MATARKPASPHGGVGVVVVRNRAMLFAAVFCVVCWCADSVNAGDNLDAVATSPDDLLRDAQDRIHDLESKIAQLGGRGSFRSGGGGNRSDVLEFLRTEAVEDAERFATQVADAESRIDYLEQKRVNNGGTVGRKATATNHPPPPIQLHSYPQPQTDEEKELYCLFLLYVTRKAPPPYCKWKAPQCTFDLLVTSLGGSASHSAFVLLADAGLKVRHEKVRACCGVRACVRACVRVRIQVLSFVVVSTRWLTHSLSTHSDTLTHSLTLSLTNSPLARTHAFIQTCTRT